jgi:hypothetical protein
VKRVVVTVLAGLVVWTAGVVTVAGMLVVDVVLVAAVITAPVGLAMVVAAVVAGAVVLVEVVVAGCGMAVGVLSPQAVTDRVINRVTLKAARNRQDFKLFLLSITPHF